MDKLTITVGESYHLKDGKNYTVNKNGGVVWRCQIIETGEAVNIRKEKFQEDALYHIQAESVAHMTAKPVGKKARLTLHNKSVVVGTCFGTHFVADNGQEFPESMYQAHLESGKLKVSYI